jgi:hypothetical protein
VSTPWPNVYFGGAPTLAIGAESAAGDDDVEMGMEVELLTPGVEHSGEAQITAQAMASELEEGLAGAMEEQRIKAGGIEQNQRVEFLGQSEDAMIIGDGKQAGQLVLEPAAAFGGQAPGTMTVAAGTGRGVAAAAVGALEKVPA